MVPKVPIQPVATTRALREEAAVQLAAQRADAALRRVSRRPGRLVVGPWLSEVGFEVLYWIPLLRWVAARGGWDPANVTVVTRGGAGAWYADLADDVLDVFERMTPEELHAHHEDKFVTKRSQKQMELEPIDREILGWVDERLGGEPYTLLHPSRMYHLFRAFWARRRPITFVERRTVFAPLPPPALAGAEADAVAALPRPYVAIKPYFSSCFPDDERNREWLDRVIGRLVQSVNVVLLSTPFEVDDHRDWEGAGEVIDVRHLMRPETNLAVQTAIIAGARALLTTYGGFSYLGPFLGVPTFSFHSHENFNQTHLDVMARAAKALRGDAPHGQFVPFGIGQAEVLEGLLAGAATLR